MCLFWGLNLLHRGVNSTRVSQFYYHPPIRWFQLFVCFCRVVFVCWCRVRPNHVPIPPRLPPLPPPGHDCPMLPSQALPLPLQSPDWSVKTWSGDNMVGCAHVLFRPLALARFFGSVNWPCFLSSVGPGPFLIVWIMWRVQQLSNMTIYIVIIITEMTWIYPGNLCCCYEERGVWGEDISRLFSYWFWVGWVCRSKNDWFGPKCLGVQIVDCSPFLIC